MPGFWYFFTCSFSYYCQSCLYLCQRRLKYKPKLQTLENFPVGWKKFVDFLLSIIWHLIQICPEFLHLIKFRPDCENTAKSLFFIAQRAAKTGMIGNCLLSFIPIKLMQISLILFYNYAPWISFRQDCYFFLFFW